MKLQAHSDAGIGSNSMKSLRILLVEDNALLAMMLGEVLAGMGHTVCATASTEIAAIDAADQQKPDLMIVDAGLRQGSGASAVDEICRWEPIPHLFLSGDIRPIKAMRPDAVALRKPFRMSDLTRAIDLALNKQVQPTSA